MRFTTPLFAAIIVVGVLALGVRAGGKPFYDMSEVKLQCTGFDTNTNSCAEWTMSGRMKGEEVGNDGCFSGDMMVMERDFGPIRMKDLLVGHYILGFDDTTNNVIYSRVSTFLHRAPYDLFHYLRFSYGDDGGLVDVTPTHNVALNEAFDYQFAEEAKIGDRLYTSLMMYDVITHIDNTVEVGAYAPYTEMGNYFVGSDAEHMILAHNLADIRNPLVYEGPIDAMMKITSVIDTYVFQVGTDSPREFIHPIAELGKQLGISN